MTECNQDQAKEPDVSTLEAALAYLARGWSAIPLCPPDHKNVGDNHRARCSSPGKAPLGSWKAAQKRLLTEKELHQAWTLSPHANVGVVMGRISGLVGIDIDTLDGAQLCASWFQGSPPRTYHFHTPSGGQRLLYSLPEGVVVQTRSFRDASGKESLRILGEGSQTVMPPSMGANGTAYTLDLHTLAECVPCPEEVFQHLEAPRDLGDDQGGAMGAPGAAGPIQAAAPLHVWTPHWPSPEEQEQAEARAIKFLHVCEPAISGQNGSGQTFKMACKLIWMFRLPADRALALLRSEYNPRCDPPWSEEELRHKVKHALERGRPETPIELKDPMMDNKPITPPYIPGKGGPKVEIPQHPALPRKKDKAEPEALIRRAETVEWEPVIWLWQDYLPRGMLAILDGDPGLGKSTMLLDIAARVSGARHGEMPDTSQGTTGHVIIMSSEDDEKRIMRPRLDANGALLNNVSFWSEIKDNPSDPDSLRTVELPADLPIMEKAIKKHQAVLVILDPLVGFLSGSVDYTKDQDIRRCMGKMKAIAERTQCAIVCLRHLNKSSNNNPLYRGGGSIGIIGGARVGLVVGADPSNPAIRVLAGNKSNIGKLPASQAFLVESHSENGHACIRWIGESPLGARDLVGAPESPEKAEEIQERRSQVQAGCHFLMEELGSGRKPIKEVLRHAREAGIAQRTLQRAIKRLNIKTKYNDPHDEMKCHTWRLPDEDVNADPDND